MATTEKDVPAARVAALGDRVIYRGTDGIERPGIITLATSEDVVTLVAFGALYGDPPADLVQGVRKAAQRNQDPHTWRFA